MRLPCFLRIGWLSGGNDLEDLLDQHSQALLARDFERARRLREGQWRELACLMLLAEHIAAALQPVAMREGARQRLYSSLAPSPPPRRRERLTAAVREHPRGAVLGAAILGTAVSSGMVAVYRRRKRQEEPVSAASLS